MYLIIGITHDYGRVIQDPGSAGLWRIFDVIEQEGAVVRS